MNLNQIDTSKLMFDIKECGDDDNILKVFPELENYEEFKLRLKLPRTKVIKTIILLYDKNSELRTRIDDPGQRKRVAAQLAGFGYKDERFSEDIEKFILGMDRNANKMIIRYCRMQYSGTWTTLMVLEQKRDKILQRISDDEEEKTDKPADELKKQIGNLGEVNKMINILIDELLSGDTHLLSTKSLYAEIEEEKLQLSPEFIAHKKKSGEQIVDIMPYGKDYEPQVPRSG